MRQISRYALATVLCMSVAFGVHLFWQFEARRMKANGRGFEATFYMAPGITTCINGIILLAGLIGLLGLILDRTPARRLQAGSAGFFALCWFVTRW